MIFAAAFSGVQMIPMIQHSSQNIYVFVFQNKYCIQYDPKILYVNSLFFQFSIIYARLFLLISTPTTCTRHKLMSYYSLETKFLTGAYKISRFHNI